MKRLIADEIFSLAVPLDIAECNVFLPDFSQWADSLRSRRQKLPETFEKSSPWATLYAICIKHIKGFCAGSVYP